jgi:hypothetical protein
MASCFNDPTVETYTIPVGTILYHGGQSSEISEDPTHYKFFTKNKRVVATTFARLNKGNVYEYEVIKPITIHLQAASGDKIYFDTKEDFNSKEAQCLLIEPYHGYASKNAEFEIEDIGLGRVSGYLQLKNSGGRRKRKTRRRKTRRRR